MPNLWFRKKSSTRKFNVTAKALGWKGGLTTKEIDTIKEDFPLPGTKGMRLSRQDPYPHKLLMCEREQTEFPASRKKLIESTAAKMIQKDQDPS